MRNGGIQHVLGGKNGFYFLTSLGKGRLQTLPLAFDVDKKEWFDKAIKTLESLLAKNPGYRDAEMLLGDLTKMKKMPCAPRKWGVSW